jgi:hypothetical protein
MPMPGTPWRLARIGGYILGMIRRSPASPRHDIAEVHGLSFAGAWVKHSPPKRSRNASAVEASGKQNRI